MALQAELRALLKGRVRVLLVALEVVLGQETAQEQQVALALALA